MSSENGITNPAKLDQIESINRRPDLGLVDTLQKLCGLSTTKDKPARCQVGNEAALNARAKLSGGGR